MREIAKVAWKDQRFSLGVGFLDGYGDKRALHFSNAGDDLGKALLGLVCRLFSSASCRIQATSA